MTDEQWRDEAIEHTQFWIELGGELYRAVFQTPEVLFNLRGMTAGIAYSEEWRIRLNMTLLRENGRKFLDTTVPHEVAHLVANKLYGREWGVSHGPRWREVMEEFGCKPKRCHDYKAKAARTRRSYREYLYRCACDTHVLSSVRHNRVRRREQTYVCSRCKAELVYKSLRLFVPLPAISQRIGVGRQGTA